MPRSGFQQDIHGLRGLAVAAVVLVHAGLPWIAGGYAGVDVFFVISGFLITSQLLPQLRDAGRVTFLPFYARRVRRLLPAALTVIATTAIASVFCLPRTLLPASLGDAAAAAAYVPNLLFAARGTDYLADPTPSLYQHFWSLGVEEQFYLLWPLLLTGAVWAARGRRRRAPRTAGVTGAAGDTGIVVAVLTAVAVASFALSLHETTADQPWAFFPMWTRAWEFALGGLVALGGPALGRLLPHPARAALGWAGLAGVAASLLAFDATTLFPGVAALLPVASAAAVMAAGEVHGGPVLLLRMPPLPFLGRISYALYLVHWPLLQLVQARAGSTHPLPLRVRLALAVAAVPLAWVLHRCVEAPLRHGRERRLERPGSPAAGPAPHPHGLRPLLAGLAASALLAGAALGGASAAAAAPLHSARTTSDAPLTAPPAGTPFVPAGLRPALTAAADDNPPMYADGCELGFTASVPHPCAFGADGLPRMVLFGDSHAAEWQPALARVAAREGFQLVTQTKSSCRSVLEHQPGDLARDRACASWRQAVLRQLAAEPPAVVVLANFDGAATSNSGQASAEWSAGLRGTVAALPHTTRVVLLADTPDLRSSPIPCLSQHLEHTAPCATPAAHALRSTGRAAIEASVSQTRASHVDLNRYLCGTVCPPIIGDTLVYRDANHLTATFAAQLAGPLDAALRPLLAPAHHRGMAG
ncbi:MAG TPA: acyltransferase family protein [Gryllotalpicola sp.]